MIFIDHILQTIMRHPGWIRQEILHTHTAELQVCAIPTSLTSAAHELSTQQCQARLHDSQGALHLGEIEAEVNASAHDVQLTKTCTATQNGSIDHSQHCTHWAAETPKSIILVMLAAMFSCIPDATFELPMIQET